MMKSNKILTIVVFFHFFSFSQEYKIGVNLFRLETGPLATEAITGKALNSIVASISANQPRRIANGKSVQLVVKLEVPWANTEKSPGNYDFEWYKSFAKLCKDKGIKWTPLLSPHYLPNHISSNPKYQNDFINYVDGERIPGFSFLPFSPSSNVWNDEVASWIKAFVNAMVDENHISTLQSSNAIDEILVGNEMLYPFNKHSSGDEATKNRWVQRGNSITSYPTTRDEFLNNWNSFSSGLPNPLRDFRNSELAYCISGMIHVTKFQLKERLGQNNANNIGVSSKLYPYLFPRSGMSITDEISGYDNAQLGYIISQSNKFLAVDSYTSINGWKITDDYHAAHIRTAPSGKSIYLAEFNRNLQNGATPFSTTELFEAVNLGISDYNVNYFTFFAWNPTGGGSVFEITEGQKLGLYNVFNKIVPIQNPIESIKQNNFPSGAYSISKNYNNAADFSLYKDDIDWYKFSYNGEVYYLKITGNLNVTKPNTKRYGLKLLEINASPDPVKYLEISTYKVKNGENIDTEIFLYNKDLKLLASNDDGGVNTFSRIIALPVFSNGIGFKNLSNNNHEDENIDFIGELNESDISVFPNPVKDYVKIRVNRFSENYKFVLKDLTGKHLYESDVIDRDQYEMDVSSFHSGMFFLIVKVQGRQDIIKLFYKQ